MKTRSSSHFATFLSLPLLLLGGPVPSLYAGSVPTGTGAAAERAAWEAARDLYRAYGVEERMGYHCHEGPHRLMPVDWERFMDFADRHLKAPASVRGAACNKL